MAGAWPEPDAFCLLLLGGGGPALAVAGLLGRGRPREHALPAAGLAGLAALAVAGGRPARDVLAALALAAACGLFGLLRSERGGRLAAAALALARHRRAQWLALLAAGPLLGAGWVCGWSASAEEELRAPAPREPPALCEVSPGLAETDAGRPVRLFRAPRPPEPAGGPSSGAADVVVVRMGPEDDGYNCHGWVFTGGRFWLYSADVERILRDNGYRPVRDPRPGDVAVYRDPDGTISHTGVVWAVVAGGRVLVESKWGAGGRFVHAAAEQPYGYDITYYRTPRRDHILVGIDAPEAAEQYPADPGWLGPTTGRP
jgi:hypothetical protein